MTYTVAGISRGTAGTTLVLRGAPGAPGRRIVVAERDRNSGAPVRLSSGDLVRLDGDEVFWTARRSGAEVAIR